MRATLLYCAITVVLALPVQAAPDDVKVEKAIAKFKKYWAKSEQKKDEDKKVILLRSLGQKEYHHPRVAEELSKFLVRDSLAIRITAVRVLKSIRKVNGISEALVTAYKSKANEGTKWGALQIEIIKALGELRNEKGVDLVNTHISNESAWISKAAIVAAARIKHKSSIGRLVGELRNLEGDGGKKKMEADPLAEELTSASTGFNDVIKYHDQKKAAPKDRREALEKALRDALHEITRQRFRTADAWEKWWNKNKSRFQVPGKRKRR